jgi:chromate reductase, NAD(P)H dehydrogenase (quinone)
MDHSDFRILGLAGSLRRASVHRGILRAAHEVGPEWMSCESFDMSRIPYFNQDIEDEGHPELIPFSRQKFDVETGDLVDEETCERLRRFLKALIEWSERVGKPAPARQRSR